MRSLEKLLSTVAFLLALGTPAFSQMYLPVTGSHVSYAGQSFSGVSTIQAAISNAGTAGSVVIPPSYAGTDTYTNPNGIRILDLRPQSVAVPQGVRSVKEWGAVCNWNGTTGNDDTAAIQAAVNSSPGKNFGISFPSGSLCRITAPIKVTSASFISIFGHGPESGIVADYSAWSGTDYRAFQILGTNGGFVNGQTFENFTITGANNSALVSEGFFAQHTLNHTSTNSFYLVGLNVKNIKITNFDTAFDLADVINSRFEFLQAYNVNTGFKLEGQNVGDIFDSLFFDFPSNSHTSNTGAFLGFTIDQKTYPNGTAHGPEGITLENSDILSAGIDLNVGQVLQFNVANNIFDLATGNTVILANPNNINFEHNYVFSSGAGESLLTISSGTNFDGLNVSKNFIVGGSTGQIGIFIASGGTHRGAHIDGNRITGVQSPLIFDSMPVESSIEGNYGASNTSTFLTVRPGTGTCGLGSVISGNVSSDSQSIFTSNCSGYFLGYNYSPTQATSITYPTGILVPNLTLGAGTLLSQATMYAPTLTTVSVPPDSCVDDTIAQSTILATDRVSNATPPSSLGNLSLNAYAIAGDLVFHFCNMTAAAIGTPSGVYSVLAIH